MIKMAIEPDNKAKYIKLAKNTLIASVLITIALTLIEVPKSYFGTDLKIADEKTSELTFEKIEDKDAQNREVVTINGKRYVVTDTDKTIAALTDDEALHNAFGLYSADKVVENICFLRPFSDCQDFWKGYYADINYYRDKDGFIFSSKYTYKEYQDAKAERQKGE